MDSEQNAHAPTNPRRDELVAAWMADKENMPESDLRDLRFELQTMLAQGDNYGLQLIGTILLDRVETQIDTLIRARR